MYKHSKGRITALSDGIFAFAATLMVVDIGTTIDIKISEGSYLYL